MQSIEAKGQLKIAAAQRSEHGKYWRSILSNNIEKSLFHPDRVKPSNKLSQNYQFILDENTRSTICKLSGGKSVAQQVIMMATLADLLRRYTGNNSITIGQPLTPEQTKLTNYTVLQIDLNPAENFKKLLNHVRDVMLERLKFCDYPLTILADEFGLESENNANPFFDVAIEALEKIDSGLSSNLNCRILMSHFITPSYGAITISYDDGLFDASTIERIFQHYVKLLQEFIIHPNKEIASASILTTADIELLQRVNATEKKYRHDARIETIFLEKVSQIPDEIAVICGNDKLTYAQLNDKVNALSNILREANVQTDQFVAVVAERSTQMMVAILSILKVGAAYLPIDPSYPESRIKYVLQNSGTKVILTHRDLLHLDVSAYHIIDIDKPVFAAEHSPHLEWHAGHSNNLAYAIYTSGSTGKPKGVMIEHHSVVNRIAWMQSAYPLSSDDVILQKTPISFDVSVWELFWWFFSGSSVCMLEPGGEREPAKIVDTIEKHKVTTVHFVPSMLNAFLDYVESDEAVLRLKSLRKVFTSGEALTMHQVERFKKLLHSTNGTQLINLYGPTEATVDVTHLDCTAQPLELVTIGKPIDNTKIYIVDKKLQCLPIGVPGELCISGVGLARGYHELPDITADRFVLNPQNLSERWYRTGDRARLLASGEIEYLGRLDHQVKIRGYRIELQEIDTILRSHFQVSDAITLVYRLAGQDKLISYVAVNGKIDSEMLKSHVAEKVPAYMVPDVVIILEKMPLSPNGKLDRKALPVPHHVLQNREYTAPRNHLEETLAKIWCEVLQLTRIGIHDNFFAIGGNSIHFVTVLAKARKHNLEFTFQQLFSNPTVAALAKVIVEEKSELQQHAFKPFELLKVQDREYLPDGLDDAYPLSMLQAGLIFQNELTFGTAQYHDIISYIIESPINLEVFKRAVRILVNRNPIFRTSYHLAGFNEYIQMVHSDVEPPLSCYDLRHMNDNEQEKWYLNWLSDEKAHRFDWSKPGLVRLHLHVLSNNLFRYVLSQHNSALDGWSITLVHTQLFRIYNTLLQGKVFDEPIVNNHIRNYIGLEMQSLKSEQDQAFWMSMLDGAPYTNLPKIESVQPPSQLSVLFHEVEISKQLSNKIIALADRLAVPVKTILMSAHLKFLSIISGKFDVMTGYEHSGRPEAEDATKAIGLFLNTVPFRVNVDVDSWADLIKRVYHTEAALLPHRRYPMAKMKQDIGTQDAFFDSAFNYTHFYLLKELKEMPTFNLLDVRANSETEFAIRAEFCRHFFTDEVKLSLHYHEHAFTVEQVESFSQYYLMILESMTFNIDANPSKQMFQIKNEIHCVKENSAQVKIFSKKTKKTISTILNKKDQLPFNAMENLIADAWAKALSIPKESIKRSDNFFDLGGNSLAAMKVIILLNGVISLIDLMRNSTLAPLSEIAKKKSYIENSEILLDLTNRKNAPITIICFPYAGGNAINFKPLASSLAKMNSDVQVYAVEPPGHNLGRSDEALFSVENLAQKVSAEICAKVTGKVFIFGHCIGSAFAIATARLLQEKGLIDGVIVGGKLLPDAARSRELADSLEEMGVVEISDWLATQTGYGELKELSEDQLSRLVQVFKHDACSANRYLAKLAENICSIDIPFTLIIAKDDPLTSSFRDEYGGWNRLCASIELVELSEGGHYFCRTNPIETAKAVVGQFSTVGIC